MLIINAKIYTMDSDVIENGFIHIKGQKIIQVSDMTQLNVEDCNIIDLNGKNVYPGFIDAHTHLGMFENGLCFEGDDGNEDSDPSTPHLRAIDAINPMDKCFSEAVSAGITTVITGPGSANPIGGQLVAMKTVGDCIDDMIIKNPVAIKFALGENPKNVYNDKNQEPLTRMATAAIIREQLKKAMRYNDEKKNANEKNDDCDLPEFDAKCEALIPLLEGQISAHFHAHRADDIFTAIRISKEFKIKYVIVHGTEGHIIAQRLKKENVNILSGPIISDRSKPELVNLTTKSPGILSENGVLFGIITDHPETPIQYLPLCAAIAVRDGLDEYEALKAITINPAKICEIEHLVGSISEGKDADLVVYDGSPFNIMKKPCLIICNGEIQNKNI